MTDLISYLIKSSAGISIFYISYWLLLKRSHYFTLSRMLLLTGLIYVMVLPFIKINLQLTTNVYPTIFLDEIVIGDSGIRNSSSQFFTVDLLKYIYFAGLVFFLFRIVYGLIKIFVLAGKSRIIRYGRKFLVICSKEITPFSFVNMIFINELDFNAREIDKIIEHEEVHVKQLHSIDVFFAELATAVHWFNPIIWLYSKSLKEVHEFLADEQLLKNGTSTISYQKLLLTQVFGVSINHLTNNFNQTILKRRFFMMKKIKSKKSRGFRVLAVLVFTVMATGFTLLSTMVNSGESHNLTGIIATALPSDSKANILNYFSESSEELKNNNIHADDTAVYSVVKHKPEYPGGNKALYTFLAENISYPEKAQQEGIEGTVYVEFIVEKDGSLSNIGVLRGFNDQCDAEAVRVVKTLPVWKPGRGEDNKPLRVKYALPVKFLLSDGEKEKE
jgi:TonB family protein